MTRKKTKDEIATSDAYASSSQWQWVCEIAKVGCLRILTCPKARKGVRNGECAQWRMVVPLRGCASGSRGSLVFHNVFTAKDEIAKVGCLRILLAMANSWDCFCQKA